MARMHKVLAVLILATALLAGCNTGSAPPSVSTSTPTPAATAPAAAPAATTPSNDVVQAKLTELSGAGATDCGEVKTLADDAIKQASDCAMQASKSKKAFHVAYEMPGLSVGVASNAEGKLFTVQSETDNGKAAPAKAEPCPADL